MSDRSNQVSAHIAKLRKLGQERDGLLVELERSYALIEIWPEVFDVPGKARSQVRGVIAYMVGPDGNRGALRQAMRAGDISLTITRGDGETRTVPLIDVPKLFWPADFPETIDR